MTTIVTDTTRDYKADIAGANPYDTVLMRGGAYAPVHDAVSGYFTISKPITLQNYPGETPVLTYGDTVKDAIVYVNAGATLSGLSVVGTYDLGAPSDHFMMVNIMTTSTDLITIDHCTLTKYTHCGVKSMWANTPLLVQYCEVGQGGYLATDHCIYIGQGGNSQKVFRFNNLHHSPGAGLHLYSDEQNCLIYGNVCHHNGQWGMLVTGSGHTIANNACAANNRGIDFYHYELANLVVKNNIFYGNTTMDMAATISGGEGFTNQDFDANCYLTQNNAAMVGTHDVTADPKFLGSTTWLDYRLACGSPAKDIGVPVTGVTTLLDPRQLVLATKSVGPLWSMGPWDYNI